MAKAVVTVSKLDQPYKCGDWHDPALKWTVQGPGAERQDFSTKASATTYASIRRKAKDANEASRAYARTR